MPQRPNSYAFCGGAFGDEGKGRVVDTYVHKAVQKGRVIVYRDNGGANAGHTVAFGNKKIALHQLLSGVFHQKAVTILGKGMVIHPKDLITELDDVAAAVGGKIPAQVIIDAEATACLDTHRAFENILKKWQDGSKGSTGRGIAPAYADIIYRHPLQMRDLVDWDQKKIESHYEMYEAIIKGLGENLAELEVARLGGSPEKVGTKAEFIKLLKAQMSKIKKYVEDPSALLKESWADTKTTFVFEKAQAIGLDVRWGLYPDVTASDCTLDGIYGSTRGIIDPMDIAVRAGVIKATYMSSVGARKLPTQMEMALAHRIREDANEYGATTKRPRDIAYLDLEALKTYARVGRLTHLVLTHLDISYIDQKIKVGTGYQIKGKSTQYQPDQTFLNQVEPIYTELAPWDGQKVQSVTQIAKLPAEAQQFITFIEKEFALPILFITTGPKRGEEILL